VPNASPSEKNRKSTGRPANQQIGTHISHLYYRWEVRSDYAAHRRNQILSSMPAN
jgi:hypothetical protein